MARSSATAAAATVFLLLSSGIVVVNGATSMPAASVASQYGLTTSTSLAFPTATMSSSDAKTYMVANWSLSKGKIQEGSSNLAFITDPFPSSPAPGTPAMNASLSLPVLSVTYPADTVSFSSSPNSTVGGAQFYSLWNTSAPLNSMMVSYEVAFDADFDFVLGGKLPGLRGGPDPNGCSGGNPANGTTCFSTRLMWRTAGAGEVYAYVPLENNLCDDANVKCNDDDFGTSIDRGAFTFTAGQWNRITLLVLLNSPLTSSNGFVGLYFNDQLAISQSDIQYRTSNAVTAGGFYFSTFFGGDNATWATPSTQHSYFRNFEMWGSTNASTLASAARPSIHLPTSTGAGLIWAGCVALSVMLGLVDFVF